MTRKVAKGMYITDSRTKDTDSTHHAWLILKCREYNAPKSRQEDVLGSIM